MPVVVVLLNVPAPDPMLHDTPALVESFATVAVNAWDPPPDKEAVVGLMLTAIGFSVMVADADFVGSVLLVAVSVSVDAALIAVGAV